MAHYIRAKAQFEGKGKTKVLEATLLNLDLIERFARNDDGTICAILPTTVPGGSEQYILTYPTWEGLQTMLEEKGLLQPLPKKP